LKFGRSGIVPAKAWRLPGSLASACFHILDRELRLEPFARTAEGRDSGGFSRGRFLFKVQVGTTSVLNNLPGLPLSVETQSTLAAARTSTRRESTRVSFRYRTSEVASHHRTLVTDLLQNLRANVKTLAIVMGNRRFLVVTLIRERKRTCRSSVRVHSRSVPGFTPPFKSSDHRPLFKPATVYMGPAMSVVVAASARRQK
jgi:hypothetical protein